MEERSTLYAYAIIAQPIHQERSKKYLWQKNGKYKLLKHAEAALITMIGDTVANNLYRIVPYFEGYYWTDEETRKAAFIETNILLWGYLSKKGLTDDARKYLELSDRQRKRGCFF